MVIQKRGILSLSLSFSLSSTPPFSFCSSPLSLFRFLLSLSLYFSSLSLSLLLLLCSSFSSTLPLSTVIEDIHPEYLNLSCQDIYFNFGHSCSISIVDIQVLSLLTHNQSYECIWGYERIHHCDIPLESLLTRASNLKITS